MLIVGAGPVGLLAAVRLRERGIRVRVIDEHTSDGKRVYPVVLHPRQGRGLLGRSNRAQALSIRYPSKTAIRALTDGLVHPMTTENGPLNDPSSAAK